jgi:hypothetical protein
MPIPTPSDVREKHENVLKDIRTLIEMARPDIEERVIQAMGEYREEYMGEDILIQIKADYLLNYVQVLGTPILKSTAYRKYTQSIYNLFLDYLRSISPGWDVQMSLALEVSYLVYQFRPGGE